MQRKKVLFLITKATWGGAQKYVYDLATNLPEDEFEPIVAYGVQGRLSELLKEKRIATHRIDSVGRDITFVSDIASFFRILVFMWRLKPHVVHLNSSKAAGLGALAARLSGIRHIVFTVHGWPYKEKRNELVRISIYFLSWCTAILSQKVIVVSTADEVQGREMRAIKNKICYIPIGIETPHFFDRIEAMQFLGDIMVALKNHAEMPRIFTIAELTLNKGITYAIEAIAMLKDRGVHALYVVIGDGEERQHLKSLARKCGIEDRVIFTGFIRNAAQYLRAADIFLLPSVKEGMPYVLLEAAGAGLPIVTTTAVNPEIIETYQNIRAVPSEDSEKIADALLDVLREKTERELFPSQVHFSLSDMLQKTTELYR